MLPKKYCLKIISCAFRKISFSNLMKYYHGKFIFIVIVFVKRVKDLLCNLDGNDSYKSKILSLTVFLFYFNKNTFQSE